MGDAERLVVQADLVGDFLGVARDGGLSPRFAASVYVSGETAAVQSGGCGFWTGFGLTRTRGTV